ncbi:MAG: sulfatase [Pseudomonadota bacterium]
MDSRIRSIWRVSIRLLASLLLAACGQSAQEQAGATNGSAEGSGAAPNFVVFVLDDWGWRDYGAKTAGVITPNIDHIASTGFRFDNAFLTTSSCSPSRASMLLGRYPSATGAPNLHDPVQADWASLPQALASAGYHTVAAGKWHLGLKLKSAFDSVTASAAESNAEHWADMLAKRPQDEPFFFWFASFDPHLPHEAPPAFRVHAPSDITVPPYLVDSRKSRESLVAYFDEVHRIDYYIGEVIKALDTQGVLENTWIFVLADNGAPTPFAKTTLYDSGIKTPLLVQGPVGSGNYTGLVSSIDLAPTILDLAGLGSPADFQGISFKAAFFEHDYQHRDYVYAEQNAHGTLRNHTAIRSKDFLLIKNYTRSRACALSMTPLVNDLRAAARVGTATPLQRLCLDPLPAVQLLKNGQPGAETRNLADNPDFQAVRTSLEARLETWEQTFRDGACNDWGCSGSGT